MTPPLRPPMRVAEQAASLDLACHGRLDIAFLLDGELAGDEQSEVGAWDEGIRMLVEMWDAPAFSWTSRRFELGPVDVLPKPEQKPHPPLWLAGWQAEHAARAGSGGLGFLDVSGTTDEGLAMHQVAYLQARREADVHDLVCESAFAVVLDLESAAGDEQRLAVWESMGIDQAVVRTGSLEGGHAESLVSIRFLASEAARVHSES
jgi:alkanesulfonate monooxygenase SsuD/methylene tetrahydromethanopterin reductase-like flavin-dependent oxidoreductase (luciferase family)